MPGTRGSGKIMRKRTRRRGQPLWCEGLRRTAHLHRTGDSEAAFVEGRPTDDAMEMRVAGSKTNREQVDHDKKLRPRGGASRTTASQRRRGRGTDCSREKLSVGAGPGERGLATIPSIRAASPPA